MVLTALQERDLLNQAVQVLGRLPNITVVRWTPQPRLPGTDWRPDAVVHLKVRGQRLRYALEFKRTLKGDGAWVDRARVWAEATRLPVILATTYCPTPTAERLAQAGVNFVDLAGNAHLHTEDFFLFIHGRETTKPLMRQGRGEANPLAAPAALRIVYVLLARPHREWKIIQLANATRVALGWTHAVVRALIDGGIVRRIKPRGPILVTSPDELQERWVTDYGTILRPHLVLGTFAPIEAKEPAPEAAVAQLRNVLPTFDPGRRVAVGGTWGADALVHFYRGPRLVIYIDPPVRDWLQPLRLVPDERGPITLLAPVAPLMWEDVRTTDGIPVAPPLLLYADLLADPDPRAQELARELAVAFPEVRRGG